MLQPICRPAASRPLVQVAQDSDDWPQEMTQTDLPGWPLGPEVGGLPSVPVIHRLSKAWALRAMAWPALGVAAPPAGAPATGLVLAELQALRTARAAAERAASRAVRDCG